MKSSIVLTALVACVLAIVVPVAMSADHAPATGPAASAGKTPADQPASVLSPTDEPATTQPATTQPARPKVPAELIKKIEQQFNVTFDRRPTRAEYVKIVSSRMEAVLKLGLAAEKKYPDAANLHLARGRMLDASQWLAAYKKDDRYVRQLRAIASRLVASDAPFADKARADYFLTRLKVTAADVSAANAEKEIRAIAKRYEKTDAAGRGVFFATVLAAQTRRRKLADEFARTLETKHFQEPGVRRLLRQLGRHPDVGRPFEATLTKLDGKTLNMPDDLKGKVVVVDFWAIWCRPCIQTIPHMKRLYARYKDKGVEFVGISFDRAGKLDDLRKFVAHREMGWVHTYSGKFWDDPTGQRYGIRGIPGIWVVGKDGNVVSDNARNDLQAVIEKALKAPAPKPPATKPAATRPAATKPAATRPAVEKKNRAE